MTELTKRDRRSQMRKLEEDILKRKTHEKPEAGAEPLKGWRAISDFLGQPTSVSQRWAKTGMPVTRRGRYVTASKNALNLWLGRESAGEPLRVVTAETDIAAELKRGLAYIRNEKQSKRKTSTRRLKKATRMARRGQS